MNVKEQSKHVTLRCASHFLDTVIDRFGTNAVYNSVDAKHFSVTAAIAISPQFYGWLLGFGNKLKILSTSHVAEGYIAHLENIKSLYNHE